MTGTHTELDGFEQLFLNDTPLIDTRAPVEFERGSFPTATNLPLMDDDERAAVGTCYKQQGQDAAIALGHQLVSGSIKEDRISAWQRFAESHPTGALFCFRGGMRSGISQQWLAEAGIHYPRIRGGYKAMRRWLLDELDAICEQREFIVVAGKTGSAKTRLLNESNNGKPLAGSIDLEGYANHRGSAFGRRVGGQPSQISFEIATAIALVKVDRGHQGSIIAEDESKLIGRCSLPPSLQAALRKAPLVVLDTTLEERVEHSFENYILANLAEHQALDVDQDRAFEAFASGLLDSIDRIKKRLGGARHAELREVMELALADHRRGDDRGHRAWIEPLLRDYYDPMYNYQLKDRQDRVLFRGRPEEVISFLTLTAGNRV
ncbi:MAG: hypothetical protein RLZZ602_1853 [Pseudomonadota bacterium]